MLGSSFLHLAINGSTPDFRRTVISTVASLNAEEPVLVNDAICTALIAHLAKEKTASRADADENEKVVNKDARLPALFLACATFPENYDTLRKETLLSKLIVLGHHSILCMWSCSPIRCVSS